MEPLKITIHNTGGFDGVTPIALNREQLGDPNAYVAHISGGGVIPADIFGLLAAKTAKLVSIAGDTGGNTATLVRVGPASNPDSFREEIVLQSRYQRVFVAGHEAIRVLWSGDGNRNRTIQLVVQDLGEREATPVMRVEHRRRDVMRRFTFSATGAMAPGTDRLEFPGPWLYNSSGYFSTHFDNPIGHLTLGDFFELEDTRGKGAYVWVKLGGTQPGSIGRINHFAGSVFNIFTAHVAEKWTDPIWLSVTDRLVITAAPVAGAGLVHVSIDVSPLMLRRLSGAK